MANTHHAAEIQQTVLVGSCGNVQGFLQCFQPLGRLGAGWQELVKGMVQGIAPAGKECARLRNHGVKTPCLQFLEHFLGQRFLAHLVGKNHTLPAPSISALTDKAVQECRNNPPGHGLQLIFWIGKQELGELQLLGIDIAPVIIQPAELSAVGLLEDLFKNIGASRGYPGFDFPFNLFRKMLQLKGAPSREHRLPIRGIRSKEILQGKEQIRLPEHKPCPAENGILPCALEHAQERRQNRR